jgi:hypothetical protein
VAAGTRKVVAAESPNAASGASFRELQRKATAAHGTAHLKVFSELVWSAGYGTFIMRPGGRPTIAAIANEMMATTTRILGT